MKPYDEKLMGSHDVERKHGMQLRPCPFCGSAAVGLYLSHIPHVTCTQCEADGPSVDGGNRWDLEARQHHAVRLWNART
jgi:Lar family restriction alleviation protein